MPVHHTSNIEEAKRLHREAQAEDMNQGGKSHLAWASFRVPVKTGRLQKSLRQTQQATANRPVAIVEAGGVEVEGVVVDYAVYVNNQDPFWTEAEEVGRETIKRRGANRERQQRGRRGI